MKSVLKSVLLVFLKYFISDANVSSSILLVQLGVEINNVDASVGNQGNSVMYVVPI